MGTLQRHTHTPLQTAPRRGAASLHPPALGATAQHPAPTAPTHLRRQHAHVHEVVLHVAGRVVVAVLATEVLCRRCVEREAGRAVTGERSGARVRAGASGGQAQPCRLPARAPCMRTAGLQAATPGGRLGASVVERRATLAAAGAAACTSFACPQPARPLPLCSWTSLRRMRAHLRPWTRHCCAPGRPSCQT